MKRISIAILLLLLVIIGCKKESEVYSFFRPTNPKNLKTLYDGEFYSWASTDTAVIRADYFLNISGEITSYGDSIIAYGHCWSESNTNPSIGNDFDTIYNQSVMPNGSAEFVSYLSDLKSDTEYNIRSFAIFSKGGTVDTGYNPVVSKIRTLPAIDEWFIQEGALRPTGQRFDAIAFNLGDTIFFGTGNQGSNNLLKDINIYNPQTSAWEENFITLGTVQLPNTGPTYQYRAPLTNGVGFALRYKLKNRLDEITAVFVGLGDYEGTDDRTYKSKTLVKYELKSDGSWDKLYVESALYDGGSVTGAVSFTIGSTAYIGTGSHSSATYQWFSYKPALDFDGDNSTFPWYQLSDAPTIQRTGAIAFSIGNRGYFGLGKDIDGNFLKDFWEFRPTSVPGNDEIDGRDGTWVRKEDFPGEARQNAVAFVIGSQGYVGTGDNIVGDMETDAGSGIISGQTFSDVYRYDPFNDKWRKIADYQTYKPDYNTPKAITRACGFSGSTISVGYIGFGIDPYVIPRAQKDYWKYQPWEGSIVNN